MFLHEPLGDEFGDTPKRDISGGWEYTGASDGGEKEPKFPWDDGEFEKESPHASVGGGALYGGGWVTADSYDGGDVVLEYESYGALIFELLEEYGATTELCWFSYGLACGWLFWVIGENEEYGAWTVGCGVGCDVGVGAGDAVCGVSGNEKEDWGEEGWLCCNVVFNNCIRSLYSFILSKIWFLRL